MGTPFDPAKTQKKSSSTCNAHSALCIILTRVAYLPFLTSSHCPSTCIKPVRHTSSLPQHRSHHPAPPVRPQSLYDATDTPSLRMRTALAACWARGKPSTWLPRGELVEHNSYDKTHNSHFRIQNFPGFFSEIWHSKLFSFKTLKFQKCHKQCFNIPIHVLVDPISVKHHMTQFIVNSSAFLDVLSFSKSDILKKINRNFNMSKFHKSTIWMSFHVSFDLLSHKRHYGIQFMIKIFLILDFFMIFKNLTFWKMFNLNFEISKFHESYVWTCHSTYLLIFFHVRDITELDSWSISSGFRFFHYFFKKWEFQGTRCSTVRDIKSQCNDDMCVSYDRFWSYLDWEILMNNS